MKNLMLKKQTEMPLASIIDDVLILALPHAIDPVIWRMELKDIGTASFEAKQDNKKDQTDLILSSKEKGREIIASFSDKQDAVDVLVSATNAMQSVHIKQKNIKTQGSSLSQPSVKPQNEGVKWGIAVLAVIVIIGLYIYLGTLMPQQINSDVSAPSVQPSSNSNSGVPLSADDFLKGL